MSWQIAVNNLIDYEDIKLCHNCQKPISSRSRLKTCAQCRDYLKKVHEAYRRKLGKPIRNLKNEKHETDVLQT